MNEEDIKKLKDKFFKSFPVEFVGISGKIGTEFEFNSFAFSALARTCLFNILGFVALKFPQLSGAFT